MTELNPELIAKAADAIDVRRHEYRVDRHTWRPHCTCGWIAEKSYDVAAYDRHLAELTIEAVADDIRAEALEGFAQQVEADGVGWYEVIHPTHATTHIAYVHEDGSIYLPEGDVLTRDEFAFAGARGRVFRLVRTAELREAGR